MKNKIQSIGMMICIMLVFSMCDKSDEIGADESKDLNKPKEIISKGVTGNIQKGPFITGSSVIIQELDSSFVATGKTYNTTTNDDFGGFSVRNEIISPYVEVITSGFYFNEVEGNISNANLSLRSLVEVTDSTLTNVNLLTTLSKERILYLVKEYGMNFKDAKTRAQNEILEIFDIPQNDSINFNQLDISQKGNENAILLAASVVLQGKFSVGELSETISKIILDIKEDGQLNNQTIIDKLAENAKLLNLSKVRNNLINRYNSLNSNATIPFFEKYAKRLVPLEVLTTNPSSDEMEVPYNLDNITLSFNKALDITTVNEEHIRIVNSSNEIVSGSFEYNESEFKVIYHISEELKPESIYKLQVKSSLKTLDEESYNKAFSIQFKSTSIDIKSGLKAYYKFDGDFLDQTNNNYHATSKNITFKDGVADDINNQSAFFEGPGCHITMPNVINPTQKNWSYSIWVKMDKYTNNNAPFLLGTRLSYSAFWDVLLYYRSVSKTVSSYNGYRLEAPFEMNTGNWYHVVMTIENNLERVYINGELAIVANDFKPKNDDGDRSYEGYDGEDTGLFNYYDGELYISASNCYNINEFDPYLYGSVDNVRFYDRAINKFEVLQLFEEYK
ncbi:LamG-like jellyroll fold domain-containing protein [Carboxylicivirga taeanensis]|uniref:LamG-like jellyroll fold domain-containing protein n=1 Tax=Carboxylicivirga taeanensis TaxID=1416875 RepID=UPI003F6DD85B